MIASNGLETGAAWKRIGNADRLYLSIRLGGPSSIPVTIYARLVEAEEGAHN